MKVLFKKHSPIDQHVALSGIGSFNMEIIRHHTQDTLQMYFQHSLWQRGIDNKVDIIKNDIICMHAQDF